MAKKQDIATQAYNFPAHDITIQASSLEEALKELEKLLEKKS